MSQAQIRKGTLQKCPKKALNPFKQKWQSRWFVLYGNSEHGRVRLEYYDNEKAASTDKGKRVIPLSNCVSIKPVWNKGYNHVLEIVIQDKSIHVAAASKEEEKGWFKDLCKAIFGNASRNSIVQVVDKPELDIGYHSLDRNSLGEAADIAHTLHTVEEGQEDMGSHEILSDSTSVDGNNDSSSQLQKTLTSSVASELSSLVSFESGFDDASSMASTVVEGSSYPVTVRPTLASQKAGLNGTYLLQISQLNITLIDIPTQASVCEWPIQFLRRYGRGRTKFSFEASEKCNHGKGVYTFNTLEGDLIFHLVDMHARGISMRNQMTRKRTSLPEGFRPLGTHPKKLHHSEGKLIDKCVVSAPATPRVGDSVTDLCINPSDSISQSGTLPKDLHEKLAPIRNNENLQNRGMSIGSGISLEIAQNISHNTEEKHINVDNKIKTETFDSKFEEESSTDSIVHVEKKLDVSTIEEETLAETLVPEEKFASESNVNRNAESNLSKIFAEETNNAKKPKSSIKRSSSLKLPNALRRSNSNKDKDASIKKSNSVKRSSSFRNRFFKSKSTDKPVSKSEHDLRSAKIDQEDIDSKIAQQVKAKDILAKAIEDDMNRNSATEVLLNDDIEIDSTQLNDKVEQKPKRRKFLLRHKSNEMLEYNSPDRVKTSSQQCRLSSSFAGYDYKGHAVLTKTNSGEGSDDEYRRLQRRTQSVMKKVELYESLRREADEGRSNTYTFWRRKTKDGKSKNEDPLTEVNK